MQFETYRLAFNLLMHNVLENKQFNVLNGIILF